jgi:putative ABC transport system permease protein
MLDVKRRRDFRQRRWQFVAVAVTITLGVLMFAASYDAYLNLESSYQGTYDRLGFADMTVTGAEDGFVTRAERIPGVAAVEGRRQVDLPFRVGAEVLSGRAIGMPAGTQPHINQIDVVDGVYLDPSRPSGIVVESHFAADHDLAPGSSVEIFTGSDWTAAEVVGIGVSAEYLWPAKSRQEVFVAPGSFGVAFVAEDFLTPLPANVAASQTLLVYTPDADRADTDAAVSAAAHDAGAADVLTQANQPSNAALQLDVDGFQQLAIAFPALFLVAAGMAAFILLTRLVLSQRPQIGALRASGVSRKLLTRHYLSYGILLGVIGALIGVVLGVLAGFALSGAYTRELGIPDTVRELHWVTPVVGLLFGFLTGFLAAYLPARAAFRMSPAEAMRGDVSVEDGRMSLFERLIPPLRRAPVRWRLVLRGVGRDKRRSLSTVIGVMLALVLILASWGMIDTVGVLIDRQFNHVVLEDASAVLTVPIGVDQVHTIAAVPGVVRAEDVATLDVSIRANGDTYATQLQAFRPDTQLHGFISESGTLPAGGAVGGVALRDLLGISEGDRVELSFPTLGTSITTTLAEFVDEPMGTAVYVERAELERLLAAAVPSVPAEVLADPIISTVGTRVDASADREAVIAELEQLGDVAAVIDQRALYDLAQSLLGFFYIFVGMMLVFGGLMAFALIFNMISVNVAERSTEYATMRANGMPRRRIAALIMGENMLLTLIGIIPGLLVGYLVAAQFMSYYSSDMFQFTLEMRWSTLVLSALFMLAVAAISLWPGIRSVDRIDVASVVRERAI